MKNFEISKLEKILKEDVSLREKLVTHAKKISNEKELTDFLENEIIPISRKHNINLTVKELLNFEKEKLNELNLENLSQVSGGISLNPLLMYGGILSVIMLGTSIGSTQTSAFGPPEKDTTQTTVSQPTVVQTQENDKQDTHLPSINVAKDYTEQSSSYSEDSSTSEYSKDDHKKEKDFKVFSDTKTPAIESPSLSESPTKDTLQQPSPSESPVSKEYIKPSISVSPFSKESIQPSISTPPSENAPGSPSLSDSNIDIDIEKEEQKTQKETGIMAECFDESFKEEDESHKWEKIVNNVVINKDKTSYLDLNIQNYKEAGIETEKLNQLIGKINDDKGTSSLEEIKERYLKDDYLYSPQKRLVLSYLQESFKEKNNDIYLKILDINKEINKKIFLNYFEKNLPKEENTTNIFEDPSQALNKEQDENASKALILKNIFALMQLSKQNFEYKDKATKPADMKTESAFFPLSYGESAVFTLPYGMTEDEFFKSLGVSPEQKDKLFYKRASTHAIDQYGDKASELKDFKQGTAQAINLIIKKLSLGYLDTGINDYCFDIDMNQFRADKDTLSSGDLYKGNKDISRGHVLIVFRNGDQEGTPPAVLIKFEDTAPQKVSPTDHYHGISGASNHISLTNQIKETCPFTKRQAFYGTLHDFNKNTLIEYVNTAANELTPEQLIGSQEDFIKACKENKLNFENKDTTKYEELSIPGIQFYHCKGLTGSYYGYLIENSTQFDTWCENNNINDEMKQIIKNRVGQFYNYPDKLIFSSDFQKNQKGFNEASKAYKKTAFCEIFKNSVKFFNENAHNFTEKTLIKDVTSTKYSTIECCNIRGELEQRFGKPPYPDKNPEFKQFVNKNFKIPGIKFARYKGWTKTYYGFKITNEDDFTIWCKNHGCCDDDIKFIKEKQGQYLTTSFAADLTSMSTGTTNEYRGIAFWDKIELIKNLFTELKYTNPDEVNIVTNCTSEKAFEKAVQ